MTGALLLVALVSLGPPTSVPPERPVSESPLRASIERVAASTPLRDFPASIPAPAAAATGTPRCSKKAAAVFGAIIGGLAAGLTVAQATDGDDRLALVATAAGAAFGAIAGSEACSR